MYTTLHILLLVSLVGTIRFKLVFIPYVCVLSITSYSYELNLKTDG